MVFTSILAKSGPTGGVGCDCAKAGDGEGGGRKRGKSEGFHGVSPLERNPAVRLPGRHRRLRALTAVNTGSRCFVHNEKGRGLYLAVSPGNKPRAISAALKSRIAS